MNSAPYRVLLVEDNPADARIIHEWLSRAKDCSFSVTHCETLQIAREELKARDCDLIVLDLSLPDSDRDETFARMQASAPQLPIVVVSNLSEESAAVQAVQSGAQDYLVKDEANAPLLIRALRYAVERNRMQQSLRGLEHEVLEAATRQQQRISTDLHDTVGQDLAGLSFMAKSLANKLAEKEMREWQIAEGIVAATQATLSNVRAAIRGLTPVEVDQQGLMVALQQLADDTLNRFDIPCTLTYDQPVLVADNNTATHLFHIAQEAITNAIKHGQPTAIGLKLIKNNNHVTLEVSDDGAGFEPSGDASGFGTRIMQYRASVIGARLSVKSSSAGTIVTCVFEQNS